MAKNSLNSLIKIFLIFSMLIFLRQLIDVENLSKISQRTDFPYDPRLLKYRKDAVKYEFDSTNKLLWANFTLRFSSSSYRYRMSIIKNQICKNITLLIMVPSRPNAFRTRREIRQTWGGDLPDGVKIHFIIGKHSNSTINKRVLNETLYYDDVIINDLFDNYTNLPLKVYSILQWKQAYCAKTLYTLKTDDDTIVQIRRLMYWIRNQFDAIVETNPRTIFGRIFAGTKVNRDPSKQWYVDPWVFSKRRFPAYVNGPTYMLTKTTIRKLLGAAAASPFISIEDIFFTGILAKKINAYHYDSRRYFGLRKKIKQQMPCDETQVPYLTSLYNITYKEMKSYFNQLNSIQCINKFNKI